MEVPWETTTYLHRIGRSGRFGSYGIALTLASEGKETQGQLISKCHFGVIKSTKKKQQDF